MTIAADSSEQGYLRPVATPIYGEPLEDLFQRVIVGITGLAGELVRPKYQTDPPTWPGFDVDWCAYSVYVEPTLFNAYKALSDDGVYTIQGTETLNVTVSFYGPNYQHTERAWRDGMQLAQNRDELVAVGIQFEQFADPVTVPLLLKERWVKHIDIRGTFHRWASRIFAVRTLQWADGTIYADQTPEGETIGTFHTDPPPSS